MNSQAATRLEAAPTRPQGDGHLPQAFYLAGDAAPGASPLVFDSPHSWRDWPASGTAPLAPPEAVWTGWDAWIDELWATAAQGRAPVLAARFQRAFIDANRARDDIDASLLASPWPEPLRQRLQAVALGLAEALRLDREGQRLRHRLALQEEQLRLLVHQLRNPLTALRTFGHLLLRRLEKDSDNRSLVEGLLAEERQLQRYVDAISDLARPDALIAAAPDPQPLLLPPLLSGPGGQSLAEPLSPLIQRAAATATLQGRPWKGPGALPAWRGDSGSVAEIIANLLENAFRYSPQGAAVGLQVRDTPRGPVLTVWDGGAPIEEAEREAIFQRGVRGSRGLPLPGTGLGLALARDLAHFLGGDLQLVIPPQAVDPELPELGNAFVLSLPASAAAGE